jgi:hypothetical protein
MELKTTANRQMRPFVGAYVATVYCLPTPGATMWGTTFDGLPTVVWEPFSCTTNSDNASVTITGYFGPGGTVTIPDTLNGLPVTGIGTNAFTSNALVPASPIINVLIPGTVTNLGDGTFQGCDHLSGVFFQGNAPSVGANVFDSAATAYYLPASTGWSAKFGSLTTAPWLTVMAGTNGGDYSNLQQLALTAINPVAPNGQLATFVQWVGATQYVANVNSANTTVNLPAQPITLTAMFNLPPVITTQPASQTVIHGSNATFSVTVLGTPPLAFQWYFNGTNLSGETTSSHSLFGVTPADAGDYMVVVTNLYGSVTSSLARLTHIGLPPGYNQMGGLLLSAGDMRLSFVGIPGWKYALDRSFSLSPAEWVPQATNPAGDGGALLFTNTPDPTTNNFWRIRLVR